MAESRQEKTEDEEEMKEFIPKSKERNGNGPSVQIDVESNHPTMHSDNLDYSGRQVLLWLCWWFANNIGITLLNKAAFKTVNFTYPFTLSAIHMICNTIGSWSFIYVTKQERKQLDNKGNYIMIAFSFIFAMNIAVGNLSLRFVSVNFNQVMRSLVPALVMLWDMYTGKTFSLQKKIAVVPVVVGVAFACYGDMMFTALGFCITALCVFMAAFKAIAAGRLLTGEYKLNPFDLLSRMAPMAFVWLTLSAYVSGELEMIMLHSEELAAGWAWEVVWVSGVASFSLNIASFMANKVTSPLTLTIVSNAKQVSLILIATALFGTVVSLLNGLGIAIVLMGSARYSYVSVLEKRELQKQRAKSPS